MHLREGNEEIIKSQEKLLKKKYGCDEQSTLHGRTYADIFVLKFKKCKCEEDEMVVEECLSLQSWSSDFQICLLERVLKRFHCFMMKSRSRYGEIFWAKIRKKMEYM